MKPSTVTTIGQMYYCILDNYYSGPILDNRSLLVPAFAALTQELQRRGLDQPQATLPALTGKVDDDWAAFSEVCEQIFAKLPEDAVRQAVAEAALRGMAASLNDNHDLWQHGAGGDDLIGLRIAGVQGSGSFDAVVIGPMQRFARNPPKEQDAPDKDIVPISYGFRGSEALLVKRVCLWL